MNRIHGIITDIKVQNDLSLVTVDAGGLTFSAIVIDTPATADWLDIGKDIALLFKETEVIIAGHPDVAVSLRNRITGNIVRIDRGTLLSRIILDSPVGLVKSVITTRSTEDMKLKHGMKVVAMIKTNEMMLSQ